MPTYTNSGTKHGTIQSLGFPPGEAVETEVNLLTSELAAANADADVNITLTVATPFYNDMAVSQIVTTATTVVVPEIVNGREVRGVKVTLYCESGQYAVGINSGANTPLINIEAGQTVERLFRDRILSQLVITTTSAGRLVVHVQAL